MIILCTSFTRNNVLLVCRIAQFNFPNLLAHIIQIFSVKRDVMEFANLLLFNVFDNLHRDWSTFVSWEEDALFFSKHVHVKKVPPPPTMLRVQFAKVKEWKIMVKSLQIPETNCYSFNFYQHVSPSSTTPPPLLFEEQERHSPIDKWQTKVSPVQHSQIKIGKIKVLDTLPPIIHRSAYPIGSESGRWSDNWKNLEI